MCISLCIQVPAKAGGHKTAPRAGLEAVVSFPTWILGTKLSPSERVTSHLTAEPSTPAPFLFFCFNDSKLHTFETYFKF